ncbi:replication initiator protein A [Pandoraea sp. NPDC087047]|uniref:replication initiator protein A n=1 Tax=Pandoraea sp. NPDC087047 TaxID=3364390 RepID=UPI0038209CB4
MRAAGDACESDSSRTYFIATISGPIPKCDLASLEHPLFALRAGDRSVRTYTHNDVTVTVKPGADGCATVHDKDVWIYVTSQLVEGLNMAARHGVSRENVRPTVRFIAHDFLVSCKRGTSGAAYERLVDALKRLAGTRIETDIKTGGVRERGGFGLIERWKVIERDGVGRMTAIEVVMPEWLWRSVSAFDVLAIGREYFDLRKPMHRRVYELTRKHCGSRQSKWTVGVLVLLKKTGSTGSLPEFRRMLRELVRVDNLPEYRAEYDEKRDQVTFHRRRDAVDHLRANTLNAGHLMRGRSESWGHLAERERRSKFEGFKAALQGQAFRLDTGGTVRFCDQVLEFFAADGGRRGSWPYEAERSMELIHRAISGELVPVV